jgi:hypothetical protein
MNVHEGFSPFDKLKTGFDPLLYETGLWCRAMSAVSLGVLCFLSGVINFG